MKKLLLLIFSALGIGLPTPTPSVSPPPKQVTEIHLDGKTYQVYWYKVQKAQSLMLKANFEERKSASELKEKNNCEFLVNGGFYSKDNKPIGWWTNEGRTLSQPQKNDLFNGFIYGKNGKVMIEKSAAERVEWGLQSGPMLNSELRIKNDELRRRIIAATTSDGQLIFLAITLKNSSFEGPYLKDLPDILKLLNLNIAEAINLDGGTASAFLSLDIQLTEANPVGSFFCYNPNNDSDR